MLQEESVCSQSDHLILTIYQVVSRHYHKSSYFHHFFYFVYLLLEWNFKYLLTAAFIARLLSPMFVWFLIIFLNYFQYLGCLLQGRTKFSCIFYVLRQCSRFISHYVGYAPCAHHREEGTGKKFAKKIRIANKSQYTTLSSSRFCISRDSANIERKKVLNSGKQSTYCHEERMVAWFFKASN